MDRMFDPGPRTYEYFINRLDRLNALKYRDYSTALDFSLKATQPETHHHEQNVLFEVPPVVEAPREETLFPPDSQT